MDKIENSEFKRLIGSWLTEGKIISTEEEIKGTDSYEFILDGHYILHKADVVMGKAKSETIELIQLGVSSDMVMMSYYNTHGESGSMRGQINGNEFKIEGNRLRFTGHISANNMRIEGLWQRYVNSQWIDFLEMRFSKQK